MRPDTAVRLVFGAASAVGKLARTQPDTVGTSLQHVAAVIETATRRAGRALPPRLVAVSKGQPVELMHEAYTYGARHFGENYVQELCSKATDLQDSAGDIRWHYIGRMRKRTTKKLAEVPGLWMVETLDSCRSAKMLNQRWGDRKDSTPLLVMLQVNTSQEESKQGCVPEACVELGQYVMEDCPHLKLSGLMTIGRQCQTVTPNPDFVRLLECREMLYQQVQCADLELSMGMTEDYEHAIELGSTNLRIGRAIFSSRI